MAGHIPRSRLGRAIKAGVPIALVIAGAELLEGRITIEREHGQLIVTAEPVMRPAQEIAQDFVRRAKSCLPEKASAKHSDWQASLTDPAFEKIRMIREMIDAFLGANLSRHSGRSSAYFGFTR